MITWTTTRAPLMRNLMLSLLAALLAMTSLAPPAAADWLSRLLASAGERAGARAVVKGAGTHRARRSVTCRRRAATTKGPALAAHVSQEGHWTFANKAGERFTAANPEELRRAIPILAPGAAGDADWRRGHRWC